MIALVVVALLVGHVSVAAQTPGSQQPTATAQTSAEKPWPPEGVRRPGADVKAPRIVKDVKPRYTREAMAAKIEGNVQMEAIVQADGTVGEVRVVRSLDHRFGLDDEAVACLKQWRFTPGTKDGAAIPVLVQVEMTFTLRKQ